MADIYPSYIEISDDDDQIQQEQHPELPINDHPEHEDADDDLVVDPDYEQYLAGLLASSFSQNAAGIDGGTDSGDEDGFGVPPSAAEIADETDFGDETEEADFLNVAAIAGETERSGGTEEGGEKRRRIGGPETSSAAAGGIGSKKGLICSICLDSRTVEGDHRICSLPCGHLFGMSCINRWLQHKDTGKCPICNRKCELKDVLKLFVSYPWDDSVDDDELEKQKTIRELKDKCASLENELAALRKNEAKLQLEDEQRTKGMEEKFTDQLGRSLDTDRNS